MPDVRVARAAEPYVADATVEVNRSSALNLLDQLLKLRGVTKQHLTEQIKIGLWKWTQAEGTGAYPKFNTRYFSAGVMAQGGPTKINHEHVWTMKNHVVELTRHERTKEQLRAYLDQYGVACIVTVGEHADLGGSKLDGWKRYQETGIHVFDRLLGVWLQPKAGTVETSSSNPPRHGPASVDLHQLVAQRSKPEVADLLKRFMRTARFASAAPAVARKTTGAVADYFRVHDALIGEPSAAIAYVHWTGKVDFALTPVEIATQLVEHQATRNLQQTVYATSVKIEDEASLDLAEELLFLALQKVRDAQLP